MWIEPYQNIKFNSDSAGRYTQDCYLTDYPVKGGILGGIAHMNQKSLKTIVNQYARRLQREGKQGEFKVVVKESDGLIAEMNGEEPRTHQVTIKI